DSVPTSPVNDRYKSSEGYHVVPPPYIGTFMPPKPNLVFHDAPPTSETVPNVIHVESSTNKTSKEMSKTLRPDAPIIKDWTSNSEDEFEPKSGNPHQALKDKGVIDSGCSRSMTGNISYLSDFVEINGGYVAFGENPKGGKITGKDTECVVLSSDFKLPDKNHVLLRVPRENNMYNYDLKNVVSLGDLTYLFTKATLDEFNLWHRRLSHINLKTMNKLVKGNLVRRLPSKVFENNHTCVACKKGKQHRASCKSKPASSLSHPLQSIGFMRPFGCLVTILNTLDPLGKFNGKADEGFLVGYFVNSKAFRETESAQQYVLLPLWSTGSQDPQNTYADAAFDVNENENKVHVSPRGSDKPKKHDEKAKRKAKGKSPVDLST
nr:hypothetical protein [Tanacetum cinerariifolium]